MEQAVEAEAGVPSLAARSHPPLVPSAGNSFVMSASEFRVDKPSFAFSEPSTASDGLLIRLQLRSCPQHRCLEEEAPRAVNNLNAGEIVLHRLSARPQVLLDQPMHAVHIRLEPRAFGFSNLKDRGSVVEAMELPTATGLDDPKARNLIMAVLLELQGGASPSVLFMEHIGLALAAHVFAAHGHLEGPAGTAYGGLAPWQVRRATSLLAAHMDGSVGLEAVAQECGISLSHFSRGFRKSVGVSPHRWLMRRRIEAAKAAMLNRTMALSEVALAYGFADQSHFTRVFTREEGASPGAWRRSVRPSTASPMPGPRRAPLMEEPVARQAA